MARTQLQNGSQGNDVTELQNLLIKNGYKLKVDGIYGPETASAVRSYQHKMGLDVDGIVGVNTWNSLLGGTNANTKTPVSAPTIAPMPTTPKYDTSTWDDSAKGSAALGDYNTAKDAVTNYGDFAYGNQDQLNAIMDKILNREKFSYDLNGDALYQQYKDKYIKQGKMAMGDAIGQASAMTGGYGNSYAQSVGQQAYQAQLDNLNDIVPELYQMAYDKYNQEGQDLYNQYGMLSDDYNREHTAYNDKYGRLMDALGIAKSDYYDGADMFYSEQTNKNNVAGKEFEDAMSIWNANNTNAWNEAEWNRDQVWRDEDIDYRDNRDRVEDEQWQKMYDAQYGGSSGGNSSGSGNETSAGRLWNSFTGGNDTKGGSYNNGSLTPDQVKKLQKALGVTADGMYGANTQKAAGGLSAEEAYKKYFGSIDEPQKESAGDYADWDAADWNSYFAQIRHSEGKAAAEEELNRMSRAGYIPKNMLSYAATGARGSLGH